MAQVERTKGEAYVSMAKYKTKYVLSHQQSTRCQAFYIFAFHSLRLCNCRELFAVFRIRLELGGELWSLEKVQLLVRCRYLKHNFCRLIFVNVLCRLALARCEAVSCELSPYPPHNILLSLLLVLSPPSHSAVSVTLRLFGNRNRDIGHTIHKNNLPSMI